MPALIAFFLAVNRHYRIVAGGCGPARRRSRQRRMRRTRSSSTSKASIRPRSSAPGTRSEIAGTAYHPVWVEDGRRRPDPRGRWWDFTGGGTRLEPLEAVERPADAVLDYVWALPRGESNFLTVVAPGAVRAPVARLRRRTQAHDVLAEAPPPVRARDRRHRRPGRLAATPSRCRRRAVARVLVSEVHASSVRAVNYAADARAPGHAGRLLRLRRGRGEAGRARLGARALDLPLEIVEAPFRDLGDPLLGYLRELTADPDVAVSCRDAGARLHRRGKLCTTSGRSTSSGCSSSSRGCSCPASPTTCREDPRRVRRLARSRRALVTRPSSSAAAAAST